MPSVYLPAVPMRFDPLLNIRAPVIDVSPAQHFGELRPLLDLDYNLGNNQFEEAVEIVCEKLAEFGAEDFIAAVGDPILIAAAVSFVLSRRSSCNVLRWDRRKKVYHAVKITLPR